MAKHNKISTLLLPFLHAIMYFLLRAMCIAYSVLPGVWLPLE